MKDPEASGSAIAYHTNNWSGTRRTELHWKDDLPSNIAHDYLNQLIVKLTENGWDFSPTNTKILMLTHNILADEQGYRNFANVFDYNDSFIKKEDKYVAFFVDILEPLCLAYENKKYGEMFSILGLNRQSITSNTDKLKWVENMDELMRIRSSKTVGQVIDHLKENKRPRLPEIIECKEREFHEYIPDPNITEPSSITTIRKLREIQYKEVAAFARFSNAHTPFATEHSVKGAEFENVLVVVGRGWNQYNFGQMLEWANMGIPIGKEETFQRSRNLFYVSCSRPRKRLALLFTQKLSSHALDCLNSWFGATMVCPL